MLNMKKNKGFTLIELLVVISIVALLSSIVLAALNDARAKARDSKRIQDIKQLQNALELYRSEKGSYPSSGGGWAMANSNTPGNANAWNITLKNALVNNKNISSLPTDPQPSANNLYLLVHSDVNAYGYAYYGGDDWNGCLGGQYYVLEFRLETNKAQNLGPGFVRCDNGAVYRANTMTPFNYGLYTVGVGK